MYQTSLQVWPWCGFIIPIFTGYWCRCAHVEYSLGKSILSRCVCVFEWDHLASVWNPLICEDCLIWVWTLLCLPTRDVCIFFFMSFYTIYHQALCLQLFRLPMLYENIIIPSLTYIPITIGYHNGLVCYHWLPRRSRVTSDVTHIVQVQFRR